MHNGHGKKTTSSKKEKKSTPVSGGWGLFDSIAKVATSKPGSTEQQKAISHIDNFSKSDAGKQQGWDSKAVTHAITDAMTVSQGGQTEGQKAGFTPDIPPDDKDEKVVPEKKKEQYDAIEDFWNKDLGTWDIRKARQNIPLLQQLTGRKIANITADGTIIFADQMGGTMTFMQVMDKLSSGLDKLTGFKPEKALTKGGMGDQGKAALWNKLKDMSPGEFQDFLNRKGNLDRIMEFAGQGAAGGPSPDFDMNKLKSGGREYLMSLLEGTAGEDFEMLKLKNSSDKRDRQKYYELSPHLLQTSGGLEEAAMAGVSYIPGYGPVERPEREKYNQVGGGGGGIGDISTTPDTTTTTVPDYVLKQQYMPNFTPDYSGGAEQMHIAGGYWDPRTQKWIGGGPWGTTGQYQFPVTTMAQGGIVGTSPLLFKNQGGMVNDGGIKSFKKYGY